MQHHTHTTRLEAQINDYAAAVFRHVVRRLKARRLHDADDIAQQVCEVFLRNAAVLMAKYGEPERFAAAVLRNAVVSFDRSQRSQRGEGVQLVLQDDGTLRPRRQYLSGNAPRGGYEDPASGEWFARAIDRSEAFTDQVEARLDTVQLLEQCLAGLSAGERELLWRADGIAQPINELAAERGVARETLSRRIGGIRRRVGQNREAMQCAPHSDQRFTA